MFKYARVLFGVLLCCLLLVPACQKRAPQPPVSAIPYDMKVGVIPFSQPHTVGQLITGFIPEKQGKAPADSLLKLDTMLRTELAATHRFYTWIPAILPAGGQIYHDTVSPSALPFWVGIGRQYKVDLLLVPFVLDWHQRQGSKAGVTDSAHVRVEFFLLDVAKGSVLRRSVFEEKQLGLAEDMSKVGAFFKRKGAWVEAEELAQEGMLLAIKELGL